MEFFQELIMNQNDRRERYVYMHETCATDTQQVKSAFQSSSIPSQRESGILRFCRFVLDSCLDMILQQNLKKIGVNM